ncbi:translational GTPase TypA [bacterium]|nr:translational GTPase TypA [bacterium]
MITDTICPVSTIRNVAIIAHVDHGKTTLVDQLLYQSGMFRSEDLDKLAGGQHGLVMDSNPIERERGITILSKNCSLRYTGLDGISYKINIIDTPGHADFGGEVERVLKMADGVLLLVDAFDGPMSQTRFVLSKALEHGLKPIVVVNKVDRLNARPDTVVNDVFDLLVQLNANDNALDFPVVYASAKQGWATTDLAAPASDMRSVLEAIINHIPAPANDPSKPFQMLVNTLDHSEYVGRIAIGRIYAGEVSTGGMVTVISRSGSITRQKVVQLFRFEGLTKIPVDIASAGDICAVSGLDPVDIGDTVACPVSPAALPTIKVDEPTMHTTFRINDGPFSGQDGKLVTSTKIKERLERELQQNVALRVDSGPTAHEFLVSGRGLLHIGILIENMRREGFEFCVGKPEVIIREIDGKLHEPIERLVVDCPSDCQSSVMNIVGERRTELLTMAVGTGDSDNVHMEFLIPSRGLFGLHTRMMNATKGRAVMHHLFEHYGILRGDIPQRQAGVIIASETGQSTAYALDSLYDRGFFFVNPGVPIYEGQVVGEHCKENDITVNLTKQKQLVNFRAVGKDDSARTRPPREMSLEIALEYIQDDELVEVTPKWIRLRKRLLVESDRKRAARQKNK